MKARSVANRSRALARSLVIALTALCALGAVSAAAAPPNFTFTATTSTTQAGGHPNETLSYRSSSTQTLTSIYIDHPVGQSINPSAATVCSGAELRADDCPASSVVGSIATQIVFAGVVSLPVRGTLYRTSDATVKSDALYGIVLRPPLSNLGVTNKIFLTDAINYQPNGALRHGVATGAGAAAGAVMRIAQVDLTLFGVQPTTGRPLISHPASCSSRERRMRGDFSDGSSVSKTVAFKATNCAATPFNPSLGVELANNTADQRTNFAILLGQAGASSASQLQPAPIGSASVDLSAAGQIDLAALDALPGCSDAQATSPAGCPADTRIGTLATDIEGFGATDNAPVFHSSTAGHNAVVAKTGFKASHITFGGGTTRVDRQIVDIKNLPEVPISKLRLSIERELLVLASSCGPRSARGRIVAQAPAGTHHTVDRVAQIPAPDCTPAAPVITEGPDRGITINTSHVEYRFASSSPGSTYECKKDAEEFKTCGTHFVDDWQGEGIHSFTVRALRGGKFSSETTATFNIDTLPGELKTINPGDEDDGTGRARKAWMTNNFEVNYTYTKYGSTVFESIDSCDFTLTNGTQKAKGIVKTIPETPTVKSCVITDAPEGDGTLTIQAIDPNGSVATLKRGYSVDLTPPKIAIKEQGVRYVGDPDFDLLFTADDESLDSGGPLEASCARKGWDGIVKGGSKLTKADAGRALAGTCSFSGVSDGDYEIELQVIDGAGHVTVLKLALTVDTTPPKIAIKEQGVRYGSGPDFDVFDGVTVTEANPATSECSTGDLDGDGVPDWVPCAPGVPVEVGKKGLNAVNVRLTDRSGNPAILAVEVFWDDAWPTLELTDPADADSDGDGAFDQPFRPASFEVPFSATDNGEIDPGSPTCSVTPRKGGTIKGNIIISNGNLRCSLSGLPDGEADLELSVADFAGHVTVLKYALTVDDTPPAIALLDPRDEDSDGDGFADDRYRQTPFEIPFEISDYGSGVDIASLSCEANDPEQPTQKAKGIVKGIPTTTPTPVARASCVLTDGTPGDAIITISGADRAGRSIRKSITVNLR